MGKSTGQASNKSIIAKDKLSDEDFDKLVIDTSHKFAQNGSIDQINCSSPDSSSASLLKLEQQQLQESDSGACDSADRTMGEYNRLNQPKRPMNAFMVWSQAIRRELHHRFSNVQNATLSKALGRVWRSLNPTEKEPYARRANLIKANHKRNYPNYRYQPRRIQERRTRCNMLIGINLNHPVGQHPFQQTNPGCQTFGEGMSCPSTQAQAQISQATINQPYHSQISQPLDIHNGLHMGNSCGKLERNFLPNERQMEECKKLRGQAETTAQEVEYQPYPVIQFESSSSRNDGLNYRTTNVGTCASDCYHEQQCHNSLGKQVIVGAKQVNECAYPTYQQFSTFSNEHQQYYQHPNIPYEFGHHNNSYMNSYSSQAASMGYYSTPDARGDLDHCNIGTRTRSNQGFKNNGIDETQVNFNNFIRPT